MRVGRRRTEDKSKEKSRKLLKPATKGCKNKRLETAKKRYKRCSREIESRRLIICAGQKDARVWAARVCFGDAYTMDEPMMKEVTEQTPGCTQKMGSIY